MGEKVARVVAITEVAPEVVVIDCRMVEPAEMEFQAGQFLSIRVDETGDVRRSYSILSAPARRDGFELLVKRVTGGSGSELFRNLRPGDELHFTGPMGFFVPEVGHGGDALVIATGAGIAAALPLANELAHRPSGTVTLRWGLRRPDDAYLRDLLGTVRAHVEVITDPAAEWPPVHAHLADLAVALAPKMTSPMFYLVGNGDMTRVVRDALIAAGVDRRQQIRT